MNYYDRTMLEEVLALREAVEKFRDDMARYFEYLLADICKSAGEIRQLLCKWPYITPDPLTPVEYARKLCGRIDIHRKEPVERVCKTRRTLPYQRRRF